MKKSIHFVFIFFLLITLTACKQLNIAKDHLEQEKDLPTLPPTVSEVTGTENGNEISSIVLSTNVAEIQIGEEYLLSCVVLPETAKNTVIIWTSADENIAVVNDNGKIVGVSAGQTNIIASTENGVNDVCTITVKEISAYDSLSVRDKTFVDAFLKAIDDFNNPSTVTIKYIHYSSTVNKWDITVTAQNQMGGNSQQDLVLDENGNLEKPILNHVQAPNESFNLELINKAIQEKILDR